MSFFPRGFPGVGGAAMLRRFMRLSDLFPVEDVLVGFHPADKWEGIRQLVGHLVARDRLRRADAPAIVEAVLARERSMSTGMEHGIAIPHAAVDGVENVLAVMGIVSNANGTVQKAFARLGLAPKVDLILDSAIEGVEKPDRRFFELALVRSGSRRGATVHVGDLYHVDVTGARAAGLTPILVDEADLRPGADCARIRSVASLHELLTRG